MIGQGAMALALAAGALLTAPAAAEESERPWTLSAAYSRFFAGGDASSGDANTLAGSLSRRFDATTLTVSAGVTRRDVQFPDAVELTSGKAYAVGGAIAHEAKGAELALSLDYARI